MDPDSVAWAVHLLADARQNQDYGGSGLLRINPHLMSTGLCALNLFSELIWRFKEDCAFPEDGICNDDQGVCEEEKKHAEEAEELLHEA